jgi:hypothetical protein
VIVVVVVMSMHLDGPHKPSTSNKDNVGERADSNVNVCA